MNRTKTRVIAAAAICVATIATTPRAAHAYDVNGIGLGADVAVGGPTGLALTIGLGRMELDFIVGLGLSLPENGVLEPDMAGAVGLFFTLTDAAQTNFQLGGRAGVIIAADGAGTDLDVNAGFTIELDARVEHRLDDHCVINFQVGIGTQIWPDDPDDFAGTGQPDFIMGFGGTGLVGGAGFRYYFDSLGPAPAALPPEPMAAPRRAEPAP
ncbi:MAG: hypothetical protein M3Y87_34060, partial [Myxococcota bacterium]|nr:hypothetical protein [Myxococcota bacterium]